MTKTRGKKRCGNACQHALIFLAPNGFLLHHEVTIGGVAG